MSKYVAILLTAGNCSFCQRLKHTGEYDNIYDSLGKIDTISTVIKVHLNTMGDTISSTPPFVNNFRIVFPTIILVKDVNWSSKSNNIPEDTFCFGCDVTGNSVIPNKGRDGNLNVTDITRWVKNKTTEFKNDDSILYHNGSQYFCSKSGSGIKCVRKKTSRRKN